MNTNKKGDDMARKKFKSIRRFPKTKYAELAKTLSRELQSRFPGFRRDELRNLRGEVMEMLAESIEDQFCKFLLKGKTMKQIRDKFGDEAERLLKADYDGLNLFTQRDNYRQLVYILLPKPPEGIVLKDKEYTFHRDPDGPYMVVQLPDFKDKVIIAPLYDVHFGNHAHKHEKFLGYLRWIAETPNVYAILGGDTMENAVEAFMMFDQTESPKSQLDVMTEQLSTIAHKILVATPGNHEARTSRKTGIDVMQILAERLEVPYFEGPLLMDVMANTYKWSFYISHGFGNSQTKGGKMNIAAKPKQWTAEVHFFVSGHTHDCIAEPEVVLVPDPLECRLLEVKQWVVVAPSFLGWYKTYAYRAGWKPPAKGGASMELLADGQYRAFLTE